VSDILLPGLAQTFRESWLLMDRERIAIDCVTMPFGFSAVVLSSGERRQQRCLGSDVAWKTHCSSFRARELRPAAHSEDSDTYLPEETE
jgi:hypothetical protein